MERLTLAPTRSPIGKETASTTSAASPSSPKKRRAAPRSTTSRPGGGASPPAGGSVARCGSSLIPLRRDRGRRGGAAAPHLFLGHRPVLERIVASGDLPVPERIQRRRLDVAVALPEARAARMEVARARRVDRVRHVALEHDLLAGPAELGIR